MQRRPDHLYYRNIKDQKCCQYNQVKNYNSCSDADVANTASPSRADYKKPKESFVENYEKHEGPLSDDTKRQIIIHNYNNKTPQLIQLLAIFTGTPVVAMTSWDTLEDLKNMLFEKQYQYLISCLSSINYSTMLPKESSIENYEKNEGPLSDDTKRQIIIHNYSNKTPQLIQLLAIFTSTPVVAITSWNTIEDLKNMLFEKQYQYLISCLSSLNYSTMSPQMN